MKLWNGDVTSISEEHQWYSLHDDEEGFNPFNAGLNGQLGFNMGFGFTKGDIPPEIGEWSIKYSVKKGHILDETQEDEWRWEQESTGSYDLYDCGDK